MRWLFNIFNAPIDEPEPTPACIVDGNLRFAIDDEYAFLGESEGWLIFDGFFWDSDNKVWRHYRKV